MDCCLIGDELQFCDCESCPRGAKFRTSSASPSKLDLCSPGVEVVPPLVHSLGVPPLLVLPLGVPTRDPNATCHCSGSSAFAVNASKPHSALPTSAVGRGCRPFLSGVPTPRDAPLDPPLEPGFKLRRPGVPDSPIPPSLDDPRDRSLDTAPRDSREG